jgi:hypothetical protein
MEHLNRQLAAFGNRLKSEVGLNDAEAKKVATHVSGDIRFLPVDTKNEIKTASNIPLGARYEELVAFQAWSDLASSIKNSPPLTRAQVIVQNYVCFVYLKDSCFEVIAKKAIAASVAARCANYLSTDQVRDFRNAFSHANWKYNSSFTGFDCWVLVDARNRAGPMRQFAVLQDDINFWQTLSRCVAYAVYEQLK